LGVYQNGGSAIAKKTGYSIVPVYHNAGKLWAKGAFIKKPGAITLVIGKAISPSNLKPSELTEQIRQWTLEQESKFN
jgi:1-acyl-sn-glycerol-3-phosphate acyltransferase